MTKPGREGSSMKIRAGYEISYDCSQPTPMILTLSVYPSRTPDLLSWDRMRLDPAIPVNTYHDSFGNFCHVIRAPGGAGCSGKSAGGRSDLSARQPLLRNRPSIRNRLGGGL